MFFVYIIQSGLDGTFYIGQTANLEERLNNHNSGDSRYTKTKMPWLLVYTEEFDTRKKAIQRERFLKNQRNRKFYERLIEEFNSSNNK